MNNVNKLDKNNSHQRKSNSFGKLPYIFALSTILTIANPSEMKANEIINNNQQGIEVIANSNIINNIKMRTGINLPSPYIQKLESIISTNKVMQDKGSAKFTEDFIVKELQKNWGISKENQLLFIRTHIYKEISSEYLYDGADGDDNRLNEYGDAIEQIEECGKRFRNGYIEYTRQRSADAQQQSIEATHSGLNNLIKFYNLYKTDPNKIKVKDIKEMKDHSKRIIQNCKRYGIDYKTKLTKEMLKFYGVE